MQQFPLAPHALCGRSSKYFVAPTYTNQYTNPAQNLPRTTNNNCTQGMSVFPLSIRMRSTNRTPPQTPMNKCYPRWQRGGQGFDPLGSTPSRDTTWIGRVRTYLWTVA